MTDHLCIIIIIIIIITTIITYAISPCNSDYTLHLQDGEVAATARNRNETNADAANCVIIIIIIIIIQRVTFL
jgi:hypothetical protein